MRPTSRSALSACLFIPLTLLAGCTDDYGPYDNILDLPLATLPVYPGSTWIRSEGAGDQVVTELLVVETESPATWEREVRRVCRIRVGYDGSVEILDGAMRPLDEPGVGEIAFTLGYYFEPEPDVPVLSRVGAYREELAPTTTEPLRLSEVSGHLVVTIGGDTRTYSSLGGMIASLASAPGFATQEGAEAAARLAMLPVVTSQARVLGHGSGGVLQFLNNPASFDALVRDESGGGELTFVVHSFLMPESIYTFDALRDQHGVTIDGVLTSVIGPDGDGAMQGTLALTLGTDLADPLATVSGALDFGNVGVVSGYLSGGTAEVTIEGDPFTVDAAVLAHLDFSSYLPLP